MLKMLRWLLLSLIVLPGAAFAQSYQVDCAPATPCTIYGPSGTGTGDQAWLAFGKINADLIAMQAQLNTAITSLGTVTTGTWHATLVGSQFGGSGEAGTITGVLYGNGTSPFTAATAAQIGALWGCSSGDPVMEYNGTSASCAAAGGGGSGITISGTTPSTGQAILWTGPSSVGAFTPSGDCTISSSFVIICQYANGVAENLGGPLTTAGAVTINQASSFTSNTGNFAPRELDQDASSGNHTYLNTDNGEHVYHSGTSAASFTGPQNSVDALPMGAFVTTVNAFNGGVITVTPGDTLYIAGTSTSVCPSGCTASTLSIAANSVMTMLKTGTTTWVVGTSGAGGSGVSAGAGTVLMQGAIPFIVSSSGTVGNDCAISGLTAMQQTYTGGYIWMQTSAIQTGSTAGWYWFIASSTTAGTCYNNVYTSGQPLPVASPTAFSTTGPGVFTQATAAEIVGPTITVPANTMGINGELDFDGAVTVPNTANGKQVLYEFGGTPEGIAYYATTGITNFGWAQKIRNRGVANLNFSSGFNTGEASAGDAGPNYLAVNTAVSQTFSYNLQLTVATDYIVLESYTVKEFSH
jgi:hypothetical protein